MTPVAPFYLHGAAGKSLGQEGYQLDVLGVLTGNLVTASLDADELTFTLRPEAGKPVPDDAQWITLRDALGRAMITGICKRSFSYRSGVYTYRVTNAYQGLLETPLLEGDRAFVLYDARDLGLLISDILARGNRAGIPVQAPAEMPEFYPVPKMAFRSQSVASAMEDALKWDPSCASRMDYSTDPPTLRFITRNEAPEVILDLDADGHGVDECDLTPYPEARALAVSFAYARRDGDNIVHYLVQSAGDDGAEANRKISLYLSGQERSDMLVTEALTTAQKAVAMAQASVDAVGASIDAAAASAQIPLTWSELVTRDSNLQAAVTAQPGFTMAPSAGFGITLYSGVGWPPGSPWTGTSTMPTTALALRTSGGADASGWYPITTGAFSAAELATAGATKETRYIAGDFIASRGLSDSNDGMAVITGAGGTQLTGWLEGYVANSAAADAAWRKYVRFGVNIAVDAIDMAPSAVAAAVKAAAASGSSSFIERAEFVEAPPDLAENYFLRQDWTPYKGPLEILPGASILPDAGDFISVRGGNTPADWANMKVPVASRSLDLLTLKATLTVGPSPRMDFSTLVDRLRIPLEDNYEPG